MYIIATSIGFVLKFDSLQDLRRVVEHLDGMGNWAEEEMKEGHPVKLAYGIYDSVINKEKAQELLDALPEIKHIEEQSYY